MEADSRSFIIYTLGRSRSAWLSRFLTHGAWHCFHEIGIKMRSLDDVREFFSWPYVGTIESGAAHGSHLLQHMVPDLKQVVIRRPVEDVVASYLALDLKGLFVYDEPALWKAMHRAARELDRISDQPGVLTVDYADLDTFEGCARVFEFCFGYQPLMFHWLEWAFRNVQMDVPAHLMEYRENRAEIEAFKSECKRELRRLAYAGEIRKDAA